MTKKVLAPAKWDERHCRAVEIVLRADIDLGLCTIEDLKRYHKQRVEVEDYEGAKSINKLIKELETK